MAEIIPSEKNLDFSTNSGKAKYLFWEYYVLTLHYSQKLIQYRL
jgi:hypothetical protein